MPEFDIATLVLAGAGLGLAVSFAVLAGVVTARLFFHASRAQEEDTR